jgi:formylglycine-generating enzyme required for sulfatase activity/lipoprotein NlpI
MYLFFDTETTGLPRNWKAPVSDLNNWPRLVQLAYLLFDIEGNKIKEGNFIIKPEGFTIPADVSLIHGITTERAVLEGKQLKIVLEEFNELISQADFLVAHNMSFDKKIIGAEFLRLGIKNPVPPKKKLCTMESSTNFCAINGPYGYKWPKLSELHYKLFRTGFEEAHNAAVDINATAKCFWELKRLGIIKEIISDYKPTVEKVEIPVEKPIIEWVDIPAGTFMMGTSESDKEKYHNRIILAEYDDIQEICNEQSYYCFGEDESCHQVTLSAFKMSKYAVTFEQYDRFCEATGRETSGSESGGYGNLPRFNVNWYDANAFAKWLGCRLPTEAEWEYACRAGTTTPFNTGKILTHEQANYYADDYSYQLGLEERKSFVIQVGSFPPNAWGLYDMHGNVLEWCSDWYGEYPIEAQTNPTGPLAGEDRVLRGGAWSTCVGYCRSAKRYLINDAEEYHGIDRSEDESPLAIRYYIGFRLVLPIMNLEKPILEKDENNMQSADKILSGVIEQPFNEAFYLINSKNIERNEENYCFLIQSDPQYLKRKKFKFISNSIDDYNAAISLFQHVIHIKPDFKIALNYCGVAKYSLKDFEGAIEDYDKAIEIDPQYASAYLNRANSFKALNDNESSIADYNKAIEIDPLDTLFYKNRANIKKKLKDYVGAIAGCNKAIKIEPKYAPAYYNRASIKKALKDFEGTIADCNIAIEIDPNYANAYYCRAHAKHLLKDYKGAITDINKTINLYPQYAPFYYNRAQAKYLIKDFEGAIADYSEAIGIDNYYANAYNNRAGIKKVLKDFEGAIGDYTKAIEIDPQHAKAYNNRANVKSLLEEYEAAIADFTTAIEIDPKYAFAYKNRELAKRNLGDTEGADFDQSMYNELIKQRDNI